MGWFCFALFRLFRFFLFHFGSCFSTSLTPPSPQISDLLLNKHNIYVQSINYPTVPRGTERLRITPGPHHTEEMIDNLVGALTSAWEEAGLTLQPPQQEKQEKDEKERQEKVMMAGWEKLMPLSMQQVQQASLDLKA